MFKLYIDVAEFRSTIDKGAGWCPFLVQGVKLKTYSWITKGEITGELDRLIECIREDKQELPKYDSRVYDSIEELLNSADNITLYLYKEFPSVAALAAAVKMFHLLDSIEQLDSWFPEGYGHLEQGV